MGEPSTARRWIFSGSEVREVLVIALGILLAFGVDASWTAFRESAQLRSHLAAVNTELAQNIQALEQLERESHNVTRASTALLQMAGPDVVATDPDSIGRLIGILWVPPDYNMSEGALEALRSSGLLAEVADPELRQLLASWPAQLNTPRGTLDLADRSLQQMISPLLHRYVSEVNLNRTNGFEPWTHVRDVYRGLVAPSPFPSDYTGLLRDRQLESLIAQRAALSLIIAEQAAQLLEQATYLRALLTL